MNRRYRNNRHAHHRPPGDHRSLRLQQFARQVAEAQGDIEIAARAPSLAIVEYAGKVVALEVAWDDLLEALAV